MASIGSKGDSVPAVAILEALEMVCSLQICIQKTDTRLHQVKYITKSLADTLKQIDEKMDGITKMIQ
jgi:hypothetical protein